MQFYFKETYVEGAVDWFLGICTIVMMSEFLMGHGGKDQSIFWSLFLLALAWVKINKMIGVKNDKLLFKKDGNKNNNKQI